MLRPFPWARFADAFLAQPAAVQMQFAWLAGMAVVCGVMLVPCVGMVGWRGLRPAWLPMGAVVVGGSFLVRHLVASWGW